MNWTTDYPTKPGFYWVKKLDTIEPQGSTPLVVEVSKRGDFYMPGCEMVFDKTDAPNAEWQGPIEPDREKPISPMRYSSIEIACRECNETDKRSFVSWKVGEVDGKPMYGIICRECWIKRLTPEQRKVYMV